MAQRKVFVGLFSLIFSLSALSIEPIAKPSFSFFEYRCNAYSGDSQALNVVIENVDDDLEQEIIVSDWSGYISALNADGSLVENWPFGKISHFEGFYPYAAFANLKGESNNNLITLKAIDDENTHVAYNQDGTPLYTTSGKFDNPDNNRKINGGATSENPPSAFDVDQDGFDEVFGGSLMGRPAEVSGFDQDGSVLAGFPVRLNRLVDLRYNIESFYVERDVTTPVYADLDKDGDIEIIVATSSHVFALHHDGLLVDDFPVEITHLGTDWRVQPSVGDVDGDSFPEILVVDSQTLRIISHDGKLQTDTELLGINRSGIKGGNSIALADMNDDGFPEIVIQLDGAINVVQGNGKFLDDWPLNLLGENVDITAQSSSTWSRGNSGPVVGDITGDGKPNILITRFDRYNDIAFGPTDSGVYAFHSDGNIVEGFPILLEIGAAAVPAIADIDNDNMNEIIIQGIMSPLCTIVFDIDNGVTRKPQWGQFLKNSSKQANFIPDQFLLDSDGDGSIDYFDVFPTNPQETTDTDFDGIGNNADSDDDNDGSPDSTDFNSINTSITSGIEEWHKLSTLDSGQQLIEVGYKPINPVHIASALITDHPFQAASLKRNDEIPNIDHTSYSASVNDFQNKQVFPSSLAIFIGEAGHYENSQGIEYELGTYNSLGYPFGRYSPFSKKFSHVPLVFYTPYSTLENPIKIIKGGQNNNSDHTFYYRELEGSKDKPLGYFAIYSPDPEGVLTIRNQDFAYKILENIELKSGWNEVENFAISAAQPPCDRSKVIGCDPNYVNPEKINVNVLVLDGQVFIEENQGNHLVGFPAQNESNSFYHFVVSKSDINSNGVLDVFEPDSDGDNFPNFNDAFPENSNEWIDSDADGIGNNEDSDDDGDGISDSEDSFPLDNSESEDFDADGVGNNIDQDDDDDGINDSEDSFPFNASENKDTDLDGIGNNEDNDDDGDGISDSEDAFPLDATETLDTDNDGIGNQADLDDDGDGVDDVSDQFPLDPSRSVSPTTPSLGNGPIEQPTSGGGGIALLLFLLFGGLISSKLRVE